MAYGRLWSIFLQHQSQVKSRIHTFWPPGGLQGDNVVACEKWCGLPPVLPVFWHKTAGKLNWSSRDSWVKG